jgi:hypothetical protein
VRYQYFPLHDAMPDLYVTDEPDNQFELKAGKPGGEVSWQITGVRHDPYILKHPIIPEVEEGAEYGGAEGECLWPPACE